MPIINTYMVQGDQDPSLEVTLKNRKGSTIPVPTGATVQFRFRRYGEPDDTFTRAATIIDEPGGKIAYVWQATDTDIAGTFEGQFIVTTGGKPQTYPRTGPIFIEITPNLNQDVLDPAYTFSWADIDDVRDIAHVSVSLSDLAMAQHSISVNASASLTGTFEATDLTWLKEAVAWQAAWLAGQPDYRTRLGITGASQLGLTFQYKQDAMELAPLASRAINNLSWRKGDNQTARSTRVHKITRS